MSNFRYTAKVFDFGMDMCGNSTAHWVLYERGQRIARSGKRREQCGYGAQSDGPEAWLSQNREGTYRGETAKDICGGYLVNLRRST